jgi:hypothetical protein
MLEILYTELTMLVRPSTVPPLCYKCCTDDSASPRNYGYPLLVLHQF